MLEPRRSNGGVPCLLPAFTPTVHVLCSGVLMIGQTIAPTAQMMLLCRLVFRKLRFQMIADTLRRTPYGRAFSELQRAQQRLSEIERESKPSGTGTGFDRP